MPKKKTTQVPENPSLTMPSGRDLDQARRQIVRLEGDQALTRILESPLPATLVQSFDEVDVHLLIHEIGPADALPVLALASDDQLQYLIDAESWSRDRLDNAALTRWLALLVQADAARMIPYLVRRQPGLVRHWLWLNLEVLVRQHDQDLSEFDPDWFSLDNVFFMRIVPDPSPGSADGEIPEDREGFIHDLVERLADYDYTYFRDLLIESTGLVPAEEEEAALHQRTVRLAEKGFLPFEEAVGVYQPLRPQQFSACEPKHFQWRDENDRLLPVPCHAAGALPSSGVFAETLARMAATENLEEIEAEFAGLCNQIAVADSRIVRRREDVAAMAHKAAGYLDVALEVLAQTQGQVDLNAAAALIRHHALGDIFRVGYGKALELKWEADAWQHRSWYRAQGLKLAFWDESGMGVLGGLLIKRPLFFDNYATGILYREFATLADIQQTRRALENIMAMDGLLAKLELTGPLSAAARSLNWKSLLLTLWARERQGLEGMDLIIPMAALRAFMADLWTARGRIRLTKRRDFLLWLSQRSRQPAEAVSAALAGVLEALFQELETEYGRVDIRRLDRRLIRLFLVD